MRQDEPQFERDEDLAEIVTGYGRCTFLLASLLVLILLFPYADKEIFGRILLGVLYSLVLIGGAYAIARNRRALMIGVGLGSLGVVLEWTAQLTNTAVFFRLAAVVFIIFLVRTVGEVFRYLLRKGPVTADKLHGALAGYVMLALLWALIYAMIESLTPGSFSLTHVDTTDPRAFFRLLYFSFTTLTTVGYGDITPVTEQAMSFVIMEQFSGVFFVGVLIARLAGLYPADKK